MSEEFKKFIKSLSVPELVVVQNDLRKFPEDKEHLAIVMQEIKRRQE